ncbi:ABC1 family-domain-containing protein [Haematococcus lacustris]
MALPALAQAVEGGLQMLAQAGGVGPALAADAQQAGSTGLDGATGASLWQPGNEDVGTLAVLAATLFGLVAVSSSSDPTPGVEGKDLELDYEWSAAAAEAYWSRRPVAVAQRAMEVARECAGLGLALLADQATGRLAANEEQRAMQLRTCIERLGPAYVKVAQALSTRVDLLSPAYFQQIQLLQDRVAPFPCKEARAVMTASFGKPVEQVFAKLSEKPVAAASLGQVYRATLLPELGGTEVAVKVQRPGVLSAVSLDLMLIRRAMALLQPQVNSDLAGLVDAWAERFLHEMDYRREAASALRFARDMEQLQGVTVAEPLPALTTDQVLTSVWLAGERLGESSAPDVRTLCTTLLNAYLIQLLDTGFLHADPHPGNLLRTPEGRIAILDFGLMTEVSEDQRWALMEYIAHLATSNWVEVAKDLQRLGFIAPGVDASEVGLVEPLGLIMGQLVSGGGAAKVNIDKVVGELEALGKLYPIQVPPFFALIVRAFSVIEGIALGVDPDYAIVMECFPYLTRRLLSDDSPRARAILRDILYGNRSRLDVERLNMMADGIAAYNTDGLLPQQDTRGSGSMVSVQGAGASSSTLRGALLTPSTSAPLVPVKPRTATASQLQSPASNQQPIIHPQALEALSIVFSKRGSYVQELLVAEAVAAVDALSKEASAQLLRAFLRSGPAMITRQTEALLLSPLLALGSRLGSPSNTLLALLPPSPLEFLDRLTPIVALTPEDREALAVLQGIAALLRKASSVTSQPATATPGLSTGRHFMTTRNVATLSQVSQELRPMMPELMPGIMHMAELFVQAMLVRLRARMGSVVALAQQPHFSTAVYSSNGQARENASR